MHRPTVPGSAFTVNTDVVTVAVWTEQERVSRIRLNTSADRFPETAFETEVADQLREYISGRRHAFTVVPDPRGTAFQLRVWQALLEIPFGETKTYGEIAQQVGSSGAARAVGAASNANPIPILIPCHRVVGRGGHLVGFGGGLDLKRRLLAIEARGLIDLPPEMGYLSAVQ